MYFFARMKMTDAFCTLSDFADDTDLYTALGSFPMMNQDNLQTS